MFKSMKVTALVAILALASAGLQGCNTFRGAGTDIKRGGEAIENAAAETEFQVVQADTILASL